MTFTDDDLKRLKEDVQVFERLEVSPFSSKEAIAALLARLEAAERIVNRMCVHAGPWRGKLDDCFKDDVKAWRKASGK